MEMNKDEQIKTQQELIDVLYSQVVDLSMMSKIELGDDVIAEIKRLKDSLKEEDMVKEYTKDDIDEMALDYIINTGGLPKTIEDWKNALWKFYEQLNKTGS